MHEPLRLRRLGAPADAPVTLDELKAQLRLEDSDTAEEALLAGLGRAATEACEAFTGRALITRSYLLVLDAWPGAREAPLREGWDEGPSLALAPATLELPRPPLQSVEQVTLIDADGTASLWPAENYVVDATSAPGRLIPLAGVSAPVPGRAAAGIEIRFTAGYGDAGDAVPEPLRAGIARLVAHLFEKRGDCVTAEALGPSGAAARDELSFPGFGAPAPPGAPPHRQTGRLRASVFARTEGTRAEVGSDLAYGAVLEFGTAHMAARPWLLPAWLKTRGRIEAGIKRALRRALRGTGGPGTGRDA